MCREKTFSKDAGLGIWGGVERVGRRDKRTSVVGLVRLLPSPPTVFSMLQPLTSHRWEEIGSFSFKCLPEKRIEA